ncbi:MAG: Ig-like domain-containing protein [Armatimonadetes bacterium]|nr:Ig-like domain-containing protein [Armatimonadota bacterium]
MTRKLFLALQLIFVLWLAGCRAGPQTPEDVQDVLPLGEKRPLEVVLASPQGRLESLDDSQAVTVAFNQPMTPLRPIPVDEPNGPLELDPSVPGRFRWKGTATLTFQPEKPLPLGTKFRVTVRQGTKSWAGQVLEKDYTFEFETPGPDLKSSAPGDGDQWIRPDTRIRLVFDQPVDPEKAREHIVLYSADPKGRNTFVDSTFAHPAGKDWAELEKELGEGASAEQVLLITPSRPLELGATYYVKVKEGMPGQQGPAGMLRTRIVRFTTFHPFAFLQMDTPDGLNPEHPVRLTFSNPVPTSELAGHVKFQPPVVVPESYLDEEYSWDTQDLYLDLAPRTAYTLTLDGGLKDQFGNALGKPVEVKFTTADYTPALTMSEGLGVLESAGPLRLPIGVRNQASATMRLARLSPADVLGVARSDKAFYGDEAYAPPGGFSLERKLELKAPRNQMVDRYLDLRQVLGKAKTGFVYANVETPDGEERRALVQVTNLGLTAKFSPERTLVMVSSLNRAEPLSGAQVEIRDGSGKVRWQGSTDSKGTVQAPGWGELGIKRRDDWNEPEQWVFARAGEDVAFLGSGSFISPWSFDDVDYAWNQKPRTAGGHAFTERGLYRAGEKVQLKGTVRERRAGSWILPEFRRVVYKINNSRDEVVEKGELELSPYGSFDQTLQLASDASTGTYQAIYSLPADEARSTGISDPVAYASFRVEAYRPAQFEVTVKTAEERYAAGDKPKAEIKGWYLFGAPMKGEQVEWSARLSPWTFSSQEWEGYDFGPSAYDPEETPEESYLVASGKGTLNDEGLYPVQLSLEDYKFRGDASLVVEGTVTSATRERVSGRVEVPVHRGTFSIGLRPVSSFVDAGKPAQVEVVALTTGGDTVQGEEIELELVRREWNSVRKADVTGGYRWITEVEDKVVDSQQFRSSVSPFKARLTPPKPGFYILRATSKDARKNPILTESHFYAHGGGYVGWAREEGDIIELVQDKQRYKPGDRAKIMVKSPYERATALVTIERELILQRFVTQVEGSADTIELPIDDDFLPNVYVSVVLLQGRIPGAGFSESGHDLGKPSFKIGYVNLPVDTGTKRLKVEVKTDQEKYRPGGEVTVTLATTNAAGKPIPAEVSLSVADQGVLGLIGYQTPDYFDSFYGPRPLSVVTSETRLDVIGQRSYGTKGENGGGGGGEGLDYREDFASTAYWNPSIVTDEEGKATVKFTLPDSLTEFRVMATAQTRGSDFGSGQTSLVVNKPLLLNPSIPRVVRVGDQFQAGVMAVNNGSSAVAVSVNAQCLGVVLVGHEKTAAKLDAGQEKELLFTFRADRPGKAELSFDASGAGEQDALKLELSVIVPPVLRETVSTSGQTSDPEVVEAIELGGGVVPGTGLLDLGLASTALVGLDPALAALLEYPYGCLEQRLSRVLPILVAQELVEAYGLEKLDARATVEKELDSLRSFQHASGGFTLWPGSRYVNDYVTAYALYAAAMARERGYKVDQHVVDAARAYLKTTLVDVRDDYPYSEDERLVNRAFALYALTLWDFRAMSYFTNLYRNRDAMPPSALAYLLKAGREMGAPAETRTTLEQMLTNKARVEAETAYFDVGDRRLGWVYGSNVETTGLVLEALLDGGDFPLAPRMVRWLLESRQKDGGWGSTHDNFYALNALAGYYRRYEKEDPDFDARVLLGAQEVLKARFGGRDREPVAGKVDLPEGTRDKVELKFRKDGKGRLYYGARLSYVPKGAVPARDEGMAVFKTISPAAGGEPLGTFQAGETYLVTLSVVTPLDRKFVVVDDPIPGGFEVVQTTFETESQDMNRILSQADEKAGAWSFHHFEILDDRVLLFADGLNAGEHTFHYLVRARLPGSYSLPPTKAEEMYHPEIFGTTRARKAEVQ